MWKRFRDALAADLGQHLVDGLLDVCGGAAAAGFALNGASAADLPAELVKRLRHASARPHLIRTRRALVERAGHVGRQTLALLRGHLPGVVQIRLVSQQHQRHLFGPLDLVQEALQRSHVLEAPAVRDVIDQDKPVAPTHVTLLQHVLLRNTYTLLARSHDRWAWPSGERRGSTPVHRARSHRNSYIFYEMANYDLLRNSYQFV